MWITFFSHDRFCWVLKPIFWYCVDIVVASLRSEFVELFEFDLVVFIWVHNIYHFVDLGLCKRKSEY